MRTLLSSLISSGGFVCAVAFFLPWVAVSCDGQPMGTLTPYDRTDALQMERSTTVGGVEVEMKKAPKELEPEPAYWALFVVPLCLAGFGLGLLLPEWLSSRQKGVASVVLAGVGLSMALQLGVGDELGIGFLAVEADGLTLAITMEPGLYITLFGYGMALAGAVATAVMGPRLDAG